MIKVVFSLFIFYLNIRKNRLSEKKSHKHLEKEKIYIENKKPLISDRKNENRRMSFNIIKRRKPFFKKPSHVFSPEEFEQIENFGLNLFQYALQLKREQKQQGTVNYTATLSRIANALVLDSKRKRLIPLSKNLLVTKGRKLAREVLKTVPQLIGIIGVVIADRPDLAISLVEGNKYKLKKEILNSHKVYFYKRADDYFQYIVESLRTEAIIKTLLSNSLIRHGFELELDEIMKSGIIRRKNKTKSQQNLELFIEYLAASITGKIAGLSSKSLSNIIDEGLNGEFGKFQDLQENNPSLYFPFPKKVNQSLLVSKTKKCRELSQIINKSPGSNITVILRNGFLLTGEIIFDLKGLVIIKSPGFVTHIINPAEIVWYF